MVKHTLLNQRGELSPHGVAVCVEKMLDGKVNELPKWVLNHIRQSSKCRSKIIYLLEYEKENTLKQNIRNDIDANMLISYEKYDTTSCNVKLQVITPTKNDVQIGNIQFQFERPLKNNTQLYIIDYADKRILEVELAKGSTQYTFVPQDAKTGVYYYVIGTKTTSVANYFYYCTKEDKNRIMIKDISSYISL